MMCTHVLMHHEMRNVASERYFSTSHMSPQINSSSIEHIACICTPFIQCELSNVSSKGLREKMQSHIVCICKAFHQCEFSYAPSKQLPKQKHNHIGCICVIFLLSEFSNVASNCLVEKIHSHIGCICFTFSTVCFQMCPQMTCMRRSKVTLDAFV